MSVLVFREHRRREVRNSRTRAACGSELLLGAPALMHAADYLGDSGEGDSLFSFGSRYRPNRHRSHGGCGALFCYPPLKRGAEWIRIGQMAPPVRDQNPLNRLGASAPYAGLMGSASKTSWKIPGSFRPQKLPPKSGAISGIARAPFRIARTECRPHIAAGIPARSVV